MSDGGGPAFPRPASGGRLERDGMTLRDYFAAKACAGMCEAYYAEIGKRAEYITKNSYLIADAMLKAREQC